MKEPKNRTVYIRKSSQATLRELSEKSRLSQSAIIAEWLNEIQKVINEFPEYFRITVASYANTKVRPRQVQTLLAPILCDSFDIPINTSDADADLLVRTDLDLKLAKKGKAIKKKVLKK
jgi:hypothetical protein